MNQTRLESALERSTDMTSAFLISWTVYEFVIFPNVDSFSSFEVTAIFTIISLVRGYFWRRFFNNELHKLVHRTITKLWRKQWKLNLKIW